MKLVGTGRFELPTPRTPSECSTRLSHVPTVGNPLHHSCRSGLGLTQRFYTSRRPFRSPAVVWRALGQIHPKSGFDVRVPLRIPFG